MSGDVFDHPIDNGTIIEWGDGSRTQVLAFYMAEDGQVQVRVFDGQANEERTITAADLRERGGDEAFVAVP